MRRDKIVKKISDIMKTDIDHVVTSIEKLKKEIEEQGNEIKKLEEKISD